MTNTLQRLRDALTEVNPPVRELLRLAIQELEKYEKAKYWSEKPRCKQMIKRMWYHEPGNGKIQCAKPAKHGSNLCPTHLKRANYKPQPERADDE